MSLQKIIESNGLIRHLVMYTANTPGLRKDHFNGVAAVFYCELTGLELKDKILNSDSEFLDIVFKYRTGDLQLTKGIAFMLAEIYQLIEDRNASN